MTRCSFCDRSHSEVEKLIAGANVFICNRCVARAWDVLCRQGLDMVQWSDAMRREEDQTQARFRGRCLPDSAPDPRSS